jgi:hypothetical protein
MAKKLWLGLAVLMLSVMACSTVSINPNRVIGSGNVISETRRVNGFDSIDLQGSGSVHVTFGTDEQVIIKADDNIVPLIETKVTGSKLIIRTKSNTNITTENDIRIDVTMNSLQDVVLSGSGSIDVPDLSAQSVSVSLPGSGMITMTGKADHVDIRLAGSGNIYCDGLQARSVVINLPGSGNITAFASESLDARLMGSGNISYKGNPSQVSKSVTGSGSITP